MFNVESDEHGKDVLVYWHEEVMKRRMLCAKHERSIKLCCEISIKVVHDVRW